VRTDCPPSAIFAPSRTCEAENVKNASKSAHFCQLPHRFVRTGQDEFALIIRRQPDTQPSTTMNEHDHPPIALRGSVHSPSYGRTFAFLTSNPAAANCPDFVRKTTMNDQRRELFRLKF
jgi:hypothetical protein